MAEAPGSGQTTNASPGSGEPANMLRYRILRYVPNLVRDEWVNVGVLLEEARGSRRAIRLIEQAGEFARVRRLHPEADEDFLHALAPDFDARLRGSEADVAAYLQKLDQNLSNVLQLSPPRGLLADNFDAELDRLYREQVTPPARRRHFAEYAGLDARKAGRRLPAAPHPRQAGTACARRGLYAAGGSHAARLRLAERSARVHPFGFFAARPAAGQGARLHRRVHSRARCAGGNHRNHRECARPGKSAAGFCGEAFRG